MKLHIPWKRIAVWLLIITFVLSLFIVARIAQKNSQERAYYVQVRRAAVAQDIEITREFDHSRRECYPPTKAKPICRAIYVYTDQEKCLALARELEDSPSIETCDNAAGYRYFEDGIYQISTSKIDDKFIIEVLYLADIHNEHRQTFLPSIHF